MMIKSLGRFFVGIVFVSAATFAKAVDGPITYFSMR